MSGESKRKGANSEQNDGFDWSAENEVHLFYALKSHKPVGVNRHFHMICIQDLFNNLVNKDISSKVIWDHLDRLYDMEALHENEDVPFPNDEIDFSLPSSEFDDLIARKVNGKSDDAAAATKNESIASTNKDNNLHSDSEANSGKDKRDENKSDSKVDTSSEKQKDSKEKDEKETKNASSAKKRSQKTPSVNSKGGHTAKDSNGSTSSKKRRV